MKKFIFTIAVCAVAMFTSQQALATNGHQLLAIGGAAKSVAGAVTASPLDVSTMISNPAGISQVGDRADFLFDAFMPVRSVDFSATGGEDNEGGSNLYGVPGFGIVTGLGDGLTFGFGAFMTAGMGADYDSINVMPFMAKQGDMTMWKANLYSQYMMWKFTPTLSKKINEMVTIGGSLNIDYHQMGFKQQFTDGKGGVMGVDLSRAVGTLGYGATIGALIKVNEMVQIGLTYNSEQRFSDLEFRVSKGDIISPPDSMGNILMNRDGTYRMGMNFPQQVAAGLAISPTKKLKITADVKWINFKNTHESIDLKGTYDIVNMTTGPTGSTANAMPLPFGWDDVTVIAVGAQYVISPAVTVRTGFSTANSPLGKEDVFNNSMFPAITRNHFGLGADFKVTKSLGVGLAYMKAFKNELTGKGDMPDGSDSNAKISLEEDSFLFSLYFTPGS